MRAPSYKKRIDWRAKPMRWQYDSINLDKGVVFLILKWTSSPFYIATGVIKELAQADFETSQCEGSVPRHYDFRKEDQIKRT